MIDERIIKLALDFLLKFPDEGMNILNSDLCMPNIPFPTMGGHTFWTNLCEYPVSYTHLTLPTNSLV